MSTLGFPTESQVRELITNLVMMFFTNIVFGLLIVFVASFAIVYLFRNLSLWEDLTNVLLSFSGELKNERQKQLFELLIKILGPIFSLCVLYLISVSALMILGFTIPKL